MAKRTFKHPIIPGFTPDPSICRAGDDYYLITSSFEYFPGVPLFHSRDLGHILDRPEQLNLDNALPSQGIYAPTIRDHDGRFYMVVTIRSPDGQGGFHDDNIIVCTTDPEGDWSLPITLTDQPAVIDSSLFFDDDGCAWYMANARVVDEPYPGCRDIWLQELDLEEIALGTARLKKHLHRKRPISIKSIVSIICYWPKPALSTTTLSPSSAPMTSAAPTGAIKVEARGQAYSFYYATFPEAWIPITENADGRVLSTQVAGGFVGAHVGLYASSNGQPSKNAALF